MGRRRIVVDANTVMRAALGRRKELLISHATRPVSARGYTDLYSRMGK